MPKKIELKLSDDAANQLAALRKKSGKLDDGSLIRDALRLYEWYLNEVVYVENVSLAKYNVKSEEVTRVELLF